MIKEAKIHESEVPDTTFRRLCAFRGDSEEGVWYD